MQESAVSEGSPC